MLHLLVIIFGNIEEIPEGECLLWLFCISKVYTKSVYEPCCIFKTMIFSRNVHSLHSHSGYFLHLPCDLNIVASGYDLFPFFSTFWVPSLLSVESAGLASVSHLRHRSCISFRHPPRVFTNKSEQVSALSRKLDTQKMMWSIWGL